MRFIPTRVHGAIDYLWGVALIASPWLLGFATGGAAQWVAVAFGAGAILYSLVTVYELGVLRIIPMGACTSLSMGSRARSWPPRRGSSASPARPSGPTSPSACSRSPPASSPAPTRRRADRLR